MLNQHVNSFTNVIDTACRKC